MKLFNWLLPERYCTDVYENGKKYLETGTMRFGRSFNIEKIEYYQMEEEVNKIRKTRVIEL